MANSYYKPCKEFDRCNELIEKYFLTQNYKECFDGHLELAKEGYHLAQCQVGYFYFEGLGVEKDLEKAVYWTRLAALNEDRDAQFNFAWFYEEGIYLPKDIEEAKVWYKKAAMQNHDLAINKCKNLYIK